LSIELTNGLTYIVYRAFTGVVIFSGVLSKGSAKIKNLETDDSATELTNVGFEGETIYNTKFTCVVRNAANELLVEHCIVGFLRDQDRQNFTQVYNEKTL
jgi:hypothetical protein